MSRFITVVYDADDPHIHATLTSYGRGLFNDDPVEYLRTLRVYVDALGEHAREVTDICNRLELRLAESEVVEVPGG
jgi:hypothetical protein